MSTQKVRRWFVGDQEWACAASDHGPFCRLCQPVSDTLRELLDLTEQGLLVAHQLPDGQFEFEASAQGKAGRN